MSYDIQLPDEVWDQIHALPPEADEPLAEAMTVLAAEPWSGRPYHRAKPDGPMRQPVYGFGRGLIVHLILEHNKQVVVEQILWGHFD